ncbi:GIY-YIG nuclease family protein [Methylobacterium phyllostachyos]|uniref:GIY-YIG nuclease family protein n=1 Tax=Methylobacterium phyllostachyos TaxID=582672 RepID=UPI000B8138F3|nr:GIY-YIG nuclease family protein [Methylobacterium phyllostachyos]
MTVVWDGITARQGLHEDHAARRHALADAAKSYQEAERLVHKQLRPYHVALKVTGPDGTPHSATEWFRIDADAVADAMTAALGQKVRTIAA